MKVARLEKISIGGWLYILKNSQNERNIENVLNMESLNVALVVPSGKSGSQEQPERIIWAAASLLLWTLAVIYIVCVYIYIIVCVYNVYICTGMVM